MDTNPPREHDSSGRNREHDSYGRNREHDSYGRNLVGNTQPTPEGFHPPGPVPPGPGPVPPGPGPVFIPPGFP
ncbi:hypothetical protein, partial [Nonomuraea deserti]|uniref:hypothetical protein n=1 Tax=Nonomuraea deserti TaxID=1848322 RepID=UPI001C706AAE